MATETLTHIHGKEKDHTRPKASRVRKALVATRAMAISVGIGVGVAAFIGSGFDSGDESLRSSNASAIDADHKELDQVKSNLVTLQQNAGEACMAALKPYIFGGELANVASESVVSDLLTNPGNPCGDNATAIRLNYSHDATNTNRSLQLYSDLQRLEAQTAGFTDDANNSETGFGARVGLAIGGVIGTLLAVGAVYNADAELNGLPTTWDIISEDIAAG